MTFSLELSAQRVDEHIFINFNWNDTYGTTDTNYKHIQSTCNSTGDLITIGNKVNQQGNADILVNSTSPTGQTNWTYTYDNNGNDYGVNIEPANLGGYIITATSYTVTQDFNTVVIKLSSIGIQEWLYSYDCGDLMAEIPIDIEIDQDGSIFVTGIARYVANSLTSNEDIYILKLSSTGNIQWATVYDYNGLPDVAVGIEIDEGFAYVAGHCYASTVSRVIVLLKYDRSDGSLNDMVLEGGSNNDYATDFVKSPNGDLLISGRTILNGDYLATILKFDTSLEKQWVYTYDEYNFGSKAKKLITDDSNNVYSLVETTNPSGGKNMCIFKLNAGGDLLWYHFMEPAQSLGVIAPKYLTISNNRLFIVATCDEINSKCYGQYSIFSLRGELIRHRDVRLDNDLIFNDIDFVDSSIVITGFYGDSNYVMTENLLFAEFEVELTSKLEDFRYRNVISCLLIGDNVKNDYIDDSSKEFGELSDFFEPSLVSEIEGISSLDEEEFKVMKVFPSFIVADSTDTSYYGVPFRAHPFAFEVMLYFSDESVDETALKDDLSELWELEAAGFIYLPSTQSGCGFTNDDDFFSSKQFSLYENANYPEGDIDVCGAWKYSTGRPEILVGIFDSNFPMYYHNDLSENNDFSSSVFVSGYNFKEKVEINKGNTSSDYHGHSTSVASIVGAIRNNGRGIAGIAGGTHTNSWHDGVSLCAYDFKPPYSANAIRAATDDFTRVMNMSIAFEFEDYPATNVRILTQAMNDGIKKGMLFVISRGNHGTNEYKDPACFYRSGVLNIGGAGNNGRYLTSHNSGVGQSYLGFGNGMDLIAPASTSLIYSASVPDQNPLPKNYYKGFGYTSGAAPHITGIAALIYSKTYNPNDPFAIATPNDVEHIVKMSCKDIIYEQEEVENLGGRPNPVNGADELTGWGFPNAHKAMEFVDGVNFNLEHFNQEDVNEAYSLSQVQSNLEIYIPISYVYEYRADMVGSRYKADIYKVTITANYPVATGFELFEPSWYPDGGIWANQSMSQLKAPPIEVPDGQGGVVYQYTGEPGLTVVSYTSGSTKTVTLEGYIYHLKQRFNETTSSWQTNTYMPWRPFHKQYGKACEFGFTTHIVDIDLKAGNPIDDRHERLSVFPVPASTTIYIEIPNSLENELFEVEILDLNGHLMYEMPLPLGTPKPVTVAHLPKGCYFVRAINSKTCYQTSFLKY